MFQVIYSSVSRRTLEAPELETILAQARVRNTANAITGILLYRQGAFLQLLEGEESAVRATFARIQRDPRHQAVHTIRESDRAERSFAAWTMGFVSLTASMSASLGRHGLSSNGSLLDDADVEALLLRFRNGEWSGAIR